MVEVAVGHLAHPEAPALVQLVDAVVFAGGAVRVGHARQPVDRAEHAVGVADREDVLVLLVAMRPDQPLLLHQPRAEVEIGLLVHHHVVERLLRIADVEGEIGEAVLGEDGREDVARALVLEDPAIGRARQEPEPRHHRHLVLRDAARVADAVERAHVAVEVAIVIAAGGRHALERYLGGLLVEAQLDLLADQVGRLEVVAMREQVEMDLRQPVHLLVDDRHAHQQHVLAQRRVERDVAVGLGQRGAAAGHLAVDRLGDRRGRPVQQREAGLRELHGALHGVEMAGHPGQRAELAGNARGQRTGESAERTG